MTDLSLELRQDLARRFALLGTSVQARLTGSDGTVKLRLVPEDGAAAEAVLLNSGNDGGSRLTCCLSTQAGCPVGCVFCKTGSLGFLRSLSASEIVEQFYFIAREAQNAGFTAEGRLISNIVVMGMGEPLLNLGELRRALGILCDPRGTGFSKRRVTVSTSGIYGGIIELAEKGPETELAFSLTSAKEELRQSLMPGTRGNSLAKVKEALMYYQKTTGRRVTLEVVLLGGINTSEEDAGAAVDFARGLDAVVNVIPWNPVADLCYNGKALREPSLKEITRFCARLEAGNMRVIRRFKKGRGICGACGQLGVSPEQSPGQAL
jgi:23S rRNA (adenine2503-C2)-methyltransferase